MSPDLHPEELLDKAAAGSLSAQESAHLEAHLASCAACRFEQQVRADFAAAQAPTVDVENLVSRALAGMPTKASPVFQPKRRRFPIALAAAVAMFAVTGFAAVGQFTGVLPVIVERLLAPEAPPVQAPVPHRAPSEQTHVPVPAPVPIPENAPAPGPEPEQVKPVVIAKHVAAAGPAVQAAVVTLPVRDEAPVLFQRGNAARIRGERAEAALAYRELLSKFPNTDEARLTHATLGRMLLDAGDAAAALTELEAYLSTGDSTLREEVMSARALALSVLGRTSDEAEAWSALLESYPESVHAVRAKARLDELRAP